MSSGETNPTVPLFEYAPTEQPPKRRRRVWPWFVALAVLGVLVVGAVIAGEVIARNVVERTIDDQVRQQLALPADHEIDVVVPGLILPQLLAGTLNEVTVSSEDVAVDEFVGDITVTANDVPIRGDAEMSAATATVTLDEEQLRSLLSTVDGFPAETVALSDPDLEMSTELEFFGLTVPVGVALALSVQDGDIVFTPSAFEVAGAQVDAGALAQQFGPLAGIVSRDWSVCLAEYLPAGVTLTSVAIEDDQLVANADVDGGIITDPALQANGSCR